MEWVMFSKHLQEYSVDQAADVVKGLGLDGLELTVVPGGHVEPARAESELPAAFATVRAKNLSLPIVSAQLKSAEDPVAELIFRLAAEGGAKFVKLGYWKYLGFGHMARQIEEMKRTLDGIETLAHKHGVAAALHIHSGDFMQAYGPIVAELLRGRDPAAMCAYVDVGHLLIEGTRSGWKMSLDLLAPWIKVVVVKDYCWVQAADPKLGKMRWETRNCPPCFGIVPWPEVFSCLREASFDGVVSVHSEYQGQRSWTVLTTEQLVRQTRCDLEYLRGILALG